MKLEHINKSKEIYSSTFMKYGDDTRSCMWDRPMIMRYSKLKEIVPEPLDGKTILDIGCGIGGLYDFLINDSHIKDLDYTGIDIVEGMIDLSKKKYPDAKFHVLNLLEENLNQSFDYVFICGVFNVDAGENSLFMKEMLKKAYEYCKTGVAFNFISSYVNYKDNEMAYHKPEEVFQFCAQNITKKITMYHHYAKCDVAVFLYKD